MPGGQKGAPDTMDLLKQIFTQLASALLAPDAAQHQKFITTIMQGIQGYVAQVAQGAVQGQGAPGGQPGQRPPGAGGPPGAPGQGGPPPGPPPPSGAGNPMMGPPNATNINPDELRRVMGADQKVA